MLVFETCFLLDHNSIYEERHPVQPSYSCDAHGHNLTEPLNHDIFGFDVVIGCSAEGAVVTRRKDGFGCDSVRCTGSVVISTIWHDAFLGPVAGAGMLLKLHVPVSCTSHAQSQQFSLDALCTMLYTSLKTLCGESRAY